jgi:Secretion system C-terminal sorting domain
VEKELGIESFPVPRNEINFNPSQGELNINNLPGDVSFLMYNTIGLRVLDRTFHAVSEATINVSSLKPGIYFVNLIRNNNVIYRKKIVLN